MKTLFGGLIEFENQLKLTEFLKNMDNKTSMKIIEGALEHGMKNGLFDLTEACCLYTAINKIKYYEE